ncbi:hypothetical protein GDO78_020529, partial [Eleutherodactylus coqui]
KDIPSQAALVFDVVLLDLHNPNDGIHVDAQHIPEDCERKTQAGDYVRYHYNGTLLDGTLFDSSYSRNRTYDTYIGKGYVIAGMDEGLLGVCNGERRRITIPPHLAYGEEGTATYHDGWKVSSQRYTLSTYLSLMLISPFREQYGKTYNIVLGSGHVIIGMDMGLRDMCVGEKRTIVIPPHLGYGEAGVEGEVPGSAVLIFNIELLELVPGLPDGYMFVWNGEVAPNLFEEIDKDQDGEIFLHEVSELTKGFSPKRVFIS